MRKIYSVIVLLILTLSISSYGASLAYEGFDYGTSSGLMSGLNGGYGFSGGWVADANYLPTSLPLVGGYGFTPEGGSMWWNAIPNRVMERSLETPISLDPAVEQVYYFSAVIKFIDTTRTYSSEYMQFVLMDGTASKAIIGKGSAYNFYVEVAGGSNSATSAYTLDSNQTYLLVLKLVARDSGNDELYGLYYGSGEDTILSEPSIDMWDVAISGDITGELNKIRFTLGSGNEQMFVDEVRIGESWADVVDPDPTDSRIPEVPFDRGLAMYMDASKVWLAYEDNGTAKGFVTLNYAKGMAFAFGGKTPDQMPTVVPDALNGHPVLDFDGNDYMQLAARSYMDVPKMTTFIVLNAANITTTQVVFRNGYKNYDGAGTTKSDLWGVYIENGNIIPHWRTNTGSIRGTGQSAASFLNQYGICCFSWDGDRVRHQINNGTASLSATGANALASQHYISRIGCNSGGLGVYFTGQIAELLVYNRLLTDEQKEIVGTYLTNKYGLATAYPAASIDTCEDKWRNQMGDKADYDQNCTFGVGDLGYITEYWLNDLLIQ